LKYTVIQNELIDVTDSPAGSGLPLITVKVPGLYSVTIKGLLRGFLSLGSTARFRIVEENNVSNVYFSEDSHSGGAFPINVENRIIFIDKPIQLRYGIMEAMMEPYTHD